MVSIASLWLPIVLAAVIVFIASSVIHMLPLWHKSDYAQSRTRRTSWRRCGPSPCPRGITSCPLPAI